MKRLLKGLLWVTLVIVLAACGSSSGGEGNKQVTIGSKNFTEQYLLSKMTVFLLEENGFNVDEMSDMGSSVLREAHLNKQVDMVWDYTGTVLVTYMGEDPVTDPQEAFDEVERLDKEENDITWINKTEVNNTYALTMKQSEADELGIHAISDLAAYINDNPNTITVATDAEFANRDDGLPGLQDVYEFNFGADNIKEMQVGLQYEAIDTGQVNVAMGFGTDSQIPEYDLVVLEDDKQFFPAYHAAVGIHTDVLEEYPEIEDITKQLAEKLDDDVMRELNYRVDVEGQNVGTVAKEWLIDQGMLED